MQGTVMAAQRAVEAAPQNRFLRKTREKPPGWEVGLAPTDVVEHPDVGMAEKSTIAIINHFMTIPHATKLRYQTQSGKDTEEAAWRLWLGLLAVGTVALKLLFWSHPPITSGLQQGEYMANKQRTAKELLAKQDLIGFTRVSGSSDQILQRASSAKVTEKSRLRGLEKQAASSSPRRSGSSGL
jgi:hypothetical protein